MDLVLVLGNEDFFLEVLFEVFLFWIFLLREVMGDLVLVV